MSDIQHSDNTVGISKRPEGDWQGGDGCTNPACLQRHARRHVHHYVTGRRIDWPSGSHFPFEALHPEEQARLRREDEIRRLKAQGQTAQTDSPVEEAIEPKVELVERFRPEFWVKGDRLPQSVRSGAWCPSYPEAVEELKAEKSRIGSSFAVGKIEKYFFDPHDDPLR